MSHFPVLPAFSIPDRTKTLNALETLVIDLARVGTGTGLDLALVSRVREAVPGLTLIAGGGVRGLDDVVRIADAGCDGALVASALHDGRLSAAEVATARRWMKAPAPAPDRRCTSAP